MAKNRTTKSPKAKRSRKTQAPDDLAFIITIDGVVDSHHRTYHEAAQFARGCRVDGVEIFERVAFAVLANPEIVLIEK